MRYKFTLPHPMRTEPGTVRVNSTVSKQARGYQTLMANSSQKWGPRKPSRLKCDQFSLETVPQSRHQTQTQGETEPRQAPQDPSHAHSPQAASDSSRALPVSTEFCSSSPPPPLLVSEDVGRFPRIRRGNVKLFLTACGSPSNPTSGHTKAPEALKSAVSTLLFL